MTDYLSRYGLEHNPFLKNSKDILLNTAESSEVSTRLGFLTDTKGIGILTGEPGNGKTTAARVWKESLSPALFKTTYNCLSTLTVMDFYRQLAYNLGIEARFRKTDIFNDIQSEIRRLSIEKRVTPVIIIDEADMLSHKVLSDLQLLFNFQMDSRDLAIILLIGQPRLNITLSQGMHEPLKQRIVMNYNMGGLTKDEGHSYISKKLEGAGCRQKVFEDNAVEAILNAANGTPRVVNKICNRALMIAASRNLNMIDADIVMKAVDDTHLG